MKEEFKKLSGELWGDRCKKIAALVLSGATIHSACFSVAGYNCQTYVKNKFPENWKEVKNAQIEMKAKDIIAKEAKETLKKEARRLARRRLIDSLALRDEAFFSLRACGWSLQSIGDLFGITREAVRLAILKVAEEPEKEED